MSVEHKPKGTGGQAVKPVLPAAFSLPVPLPVAPAYISLSVCLQALHKPVLNGRDYVRYRRPALR